jgi:hypothetical protein
MTTVPIYYYIPSDLDDEQHPNAFYLRKEEGQQITLSLIRKAFPLPGQYHFRFKTNFKNTYVWKDTSSDNDKIPSYDGKIVAKVSRLRTPLDTSTRSQQSASLTTSNTTKTRSTERQTAVQTAKSSINTSSRNQQQQRNHHQQQLKTQQPRQRVASNGSTGSERERRYSDLLNMDDIPSEATTSSSRSDNGSSSDLLGGTLSGSTSSTPTNDSSDLGGLGGLDFGAPSASMPMRHPSTSFGGTSMDALHPMNMTSSNKRVSSAPRSINTQVNGNSRGSATKKKIGSPRSQALNGFLGGL